MIIAVDDRLSSGFITGVDVSSDTVTLRYTTLGKYFEQINPIIHGVASFKNVMQATSVAKLDSLVTKPAKRG